MFFDSVAVHSAGVRGGVGGKTSVAGVMVMMGDSGGVRAQKALGIVMAGQ